MAVKESESLGRYAERVLRTLDGITIPGMLPVEAFEILYAAWRAGYKCAREDAEAYQKALEDCRE